MARVTMEQIAREVGVTRATVSLAMRCHPSISASTRRRVLDCAKRLDYRPNPFISALMADMRNYRGIRQTCTLAYVTILPFEEMQALSSARRYFEGAIRRAEELGYRMDYFHCRLDEERSDVALGRILLARGIPAVLLAPSPGAKYSIRLPWEHLCAAAIGYTLQSPILNRSINHQHHSVNLAIRKCIEYGYKRVGLVLHTEEDDQRVEHAWQEGYFSYQQTIPLHDRLPIAFLDTLSVEGLRRWIRKNRPDVLIVNNYFSLSKIRQAGLRIPRNVALVLLDCSKEYEGIAGVDQRPDLVGANGIDLIVQSLMLNSYGLPEFPKTVLTEGEWVDAVSFPRR